MVKKLVWRVEEKPSPKCPYLFYLYTKNKCLREEEAIELETGRTLLQVDVALEADELPKTPDAESKRESLDPEEI